MRSVEAHLQDEVTRLRRDVAGQTRSAQNGWRTAEAFRVRIAELDAEVATLRANMLAIEKIVGDPKIHASAIRERVRFAMGLRLRPETPPPCCCSWGAAVSGEWPEFECAACPVHLNEGLTTAPDSSHCMRHARMRKA